MKQHLRIRAVKTLNNQVFSTYERVWRSSDNSRDQIISEIERLKLDGFMVSMDRLSEEELQKLAEDLLVEAALCVGSLAGPAALLGEFVVPEADPS